MKHIKTPGDGRVYDEATHQWADPVMSKSRAKRIAAQKSTEKEPAPAPQAVDPGAATPQSTEE